jgi:hypothetical protein
LSDFNWTMPSRRLEDRIQELCSTVVTAGDAEWEAAMLGLKSALREHTERLRKLAGRKLASPRVNSEARTSDLRQSDLNQHRDQHH